MKKISLLAIAVFAVFLTTSCRKDYSCVCTTAPVAIFTKPTVTTTVATLTEKSYRKDATSWCAGLQNSNPGLTCVLTVE